jgi:hypothetical protein
MVHGDPEQWQRLSVKGGRQNAARVKRRKAADPLAGLDRDIPLWRVLEIVKDGLRADYSELGLREADWATRVLSLLVLVTIAPDAFRDVEADPVFADVYTLARGVWDELKRRPDIRSQLVAMYTTEYPPALEQRASPGRSTDGNRA